jgi:glycosyltransferase involved in cell wall biosynthesis
MIENDGMSAGQHSPAGDLQADAPRAPELVPPSVTILVPCRNEGKWIAACLDSILGSNYPAERLEVLVIDGMSSDETRAVVADYAARHASIRLLDNVKQIAPAALNIGIAAAQGAVIMRMDAHVDYPADYVATLVRLLQEKGADNVGGVCLTQPGGPGAMARAIAVGMSHPLGVGNSRFRIGSREERWVDTVPFGCYRRAVFERIGLFDEDLVRNQDDELNLRLIRHGGRILLAPQVVCRYYTRDTLAKLWRMYYQYGYFKPLVVRKVGGVMTLRQLAPPILVLSLAVTATAGLLGLAVLPFPWKLLAPAAFALVAGSYLLAIGGCAAVAARKHGWAVAAALAAVFPALHVSYGIGYLRGAVEFLLLRRNRAGGRAIPMTR